MSQQSQKEISLAYMIITLVLGINMSLSLTLNKNKKFKQYIRKKTHKFNAVRFWVKGGIIFLCMFDSFLQV